MVPLILLVVTGTVTAATSRWQGDVIVTEAEVRDGSGATTKVVQLGGSVGGLGMSFSHQPAVARVGDAITLDGGRVVRVSPRASLLPAAGSATYGVQRTAKSGVALWHAGGCIELTYDATSIDAATAKIIDAAFSAWSEAAVSCGQLVATSTRRPNPPSVRDELSTVRIRRDRWCNPGNPLEPEVCYAKEASAVTRLLFVDDPSDANDGKIIDADVEFNAVDYVLVAPGETAPATTKPVLDLQAVATHEAGHALGLAHNCGTGQEPWPTDHAGNAVPACDSTSLSVRSATMYFAVSPGDTGPRTVEVTDVAGVCELAQQLTCESYVSGGCRTGRGDAHGWLVIVAMVMLVRKRSAASYDRACAMTGPLPQRIQRFEVRELLGSGGMGSVYRAHDAQLERDVAIKVLRGPTSPVAARLSTADTLDLRGDAPASHADLLREARMMAQLSHPNVLPVYEVGLADQEVFVVMEHIAGCDLGTWLATSRSTPEILAMFAQAGRGLAAAHARGIVHRDFKPNNVLVGQDERARVADFGLSAMLGPATGAMVRVDDGRGTPRYMAPELWQRGQATQSSDVFAFCAALDEALVGRGDVPARVRSLIAAGLSPDPSARPPLQRIVDALGSRRSRRGPWLVAAGVLTTLALGTTATLLVTDDRDASCDDAATALDPARRVRLARLRASNPETVVLIDERDRATRRAFVRTCVAERDKQLTAEQAKIRRSCLLRRVFELGPAVDLTIASPARAPARFDRVASPDVCEDIKAPPLPADTTEVAAAWSRYSATWDLSVGGPEKVPTYLPAMRAVLADAIRLNEQELELRALSGVQAALLTEDKLEEADQIQQEIYRKAVALAAPTYAANALLARARIANQRRDVKLHAELMALVQDLADKPTTTPALRAKVYRGLGTAARDRGDYKLAAQHFKDGLELLGTMKNPPETFELEMINQLAYAYSKNDATRAHSVDIARKGVARAKELDASPVNRAFAFNMLAVTLSANRDRQGALAARKQALDAFSSALPADHANVLFSRMDYAHDLLEVGRPAEAREHLLVALAGTDGNQAVKGERPQILVELGQATFDVGRFQEGLDLVREGVEGSISQFGMSHTRTTRALGMQLVMELELDRLDDAQRTASSLSRGLAEWTDNKERAEAAFAGWIKAELERRRGRPKQGEAIGKRALATLLELDASAENLVIVRAVLADNLLAQGKVAEARTQIDAVLALRAKANEREDDVAEREVTLARIEAAEGKHAEAAARARRALAVFERYPRHLVSRADAERLISAK